MGGKPATEREYAPALWCVPLSFARGKGFRVAKPELVAWDDPPIDKMKPEDVKEKLEAMGFVLVGRCPDPMHPGQVTISDPALDRENELTRKRKDENVQRVRDNFKRNMQNPSPSEATQGG